MKRGSPLVGIFITVFIDMLSFGVFIPDIQARGKDLGATGPMLGAIIASFSLTQLVTAPILGRLSDRIGRRGILLISTALSTLSFLAYAFAHSIPMMFASRILGGIAGANIGVAYAYVADVTEPSERSKGMGMIGAAFGLGFIIGPPLGAQLVEWGGGQPFLLGMVGAALCVVNFAYVAAYLSEPVRRHDSNAEAFSVGNLVRAVSTPGLGLLLILFFAYGFAFSNLESTFFLLAMGHWGLNRSGGAIVLLVVGVTAALIQGGLMRVLAPKFGDLALVRAGYLIVGPTLAVLPFCPPWAPLLLSAVVLGIGNGIAQPTVGSLISRSAPREMQGGIFGITQALGALARVIGPLVGNSLYAKNYAWPYFLAGAVMLVPIIGVWRIRLQFAQTDGDAEPVHA
jgi:DHA1 family tetracycline resistance protein-like MFS transporter